MVLGGTGSVGGGTGWYLVVLGQYRSVLIDTWWYWVNMERYWLIYVGTSSAEVAREHGWHPPKSLDSDENFKPEHTLFCHELRFVAIYALFLEIFGHKKCLFG